MRSFFLCVGEGTYIGRAGHSLVHQTKENETGIEGKTFEVCL